MSASSKIGSAAQFAGMRGEACTEGSEEKCVWVPIENTLESEENAGATHISRGVQNGPRILKDVLGNAGFDRLDHVASSRMRDEEIWITASLRIEARYRLSGKARNRTVKLVL